MGAIARNIANNITTNGVFTASALNSSSVTGITVLANASDGITFISSQTASNSASISFTSGLTSTYKAYKFLFINCRPRTNTQPLQFNMSTDSGSNYNVTKTTTYYQAYQSEVGGYTNFAYTDLGLSQSTAFQQFSANIKNDADTSVSGSMILFNPSSTTYVKHYICNIDGIDSGDFQANTIISGYGNTTSAINAMQFKYASGNMDGTIALYGIK